MTSSSQDFLVIVATLSFAMFGFASSIEILRTISKVKSERIHFNGLSLLAIFQIFSCLIPLAISSGGNYVFFSGLACIVASTSIFIFTIFQVASGRLRFVFPKVSILLIFLTFLILIVQAWNTFVITSEIVYNLIVLWGFFLLMFRFYLVMSVASDHQI
jgi:hypothetical protein